MRVIAFKALLSHWRRRPLQLLTLVIGIALATGLWSGVQAINAEARASYARAASVLEQGTLRQIVAKDGSGVSTETYAKLRRAGWNVSPVIEGMYRFGPARIKLIGIEPLTMPQEGQVASITTASDLSDFLSARGQLVVSAATAEKISGKTDIGIRISEEVPEDAAFLDIAVADRLLKANGRVSRLVVAPEQRPELEAIEHIASEVVVRETADQPDVGRLTDSFHLNLTAFGSLSFIVGLFIVYSATGLTFEQRRGTFRTLRSLGISLPALTTMLVIACALILGVVGSGLVAGFGTLGCLLLGSAFLLPGLLAIALKFAERISYAALTQWFWADTRLQLPGLSLALMALLLALSANIGVGTMVSSFRLTFLGWLDQRLAAELYVTAKDEDEAKQLREWLPRHSTAVLPIWSVEGNVLGEKLQIFGVADDPSYRDHWPLIVSDNNAWDQVASGKGALINEQMWRRGATSLGATIPMPGDWDATVVGVYSDYGNPKGQVIVGVDSLVAHYPEVPKLRYGIRVPPEQASSLRQKLVREFGLAETAIIDQASLKRQSRAVFEQTFTVTGALNVLTLGVAGFAMFSSLLTLSGIRLPQLAPVWAMGVRRRDLALYEVARTLALWLATFVTAIPVGLGLAWVLLAIVNVEAFGWRLPMTVFPLDWLWLGAVALVVALLSVLVPVRRLATINPADLLRVFADES